MHISVDAVNVMAAYQPVVLTCVHCGGRIETLLLRILVGDQLNAQFLLQFVYLNPLHVSSHSVLILRRTIVLTL